MGLKFNANKMSKLPVLMIGLGLLTFAAPAEAQKAAPSCQAFCTQRCTTYTQKNACMAQCVPKCNATKAGQK
jgi:hypothetical protein